MQSRADAKLNSIRFISAASVRRLLRTISKVFSRKDSFLRHREYIAQNPVKAGLVNSPEEFPFSFSYLAKQKEARAKEAAEKVDNADPSATKVPRDDKEQSIYRHD
ncbi:MAG TPA: hypothetical protein VMU45_05795 [Candidatus Eisenbacteria bacterium]|nr:hypothetical protein [Candidatus Eisenbacteria bacterium]